MSNELIPMSDIEKMANAIAKSGLFGMKQPEQALALMLIAHAEGRHPALAARDYDIIQGKPAKKAEAMLRDFLASDGKVEWHALSDEKADATFTHPAGGSARIDWTMDRAKKAGLTGNPTWGKYPRAMLRSRCVSEGIKTVCPGATSGMYTPEEEESITPIKPRPMKDITPEPSKDAAGREILTPHDKKTGEIVETDLQRLQARAEAIAQKRGTIDLEAWFKDELSADEKRLLRSDTATWSAIKDAAAATDKQPLLSGAA